MTNRWPTRLALAEGRANALTGRWASALVLLLVAWACAAAGLGHGLDIARLAEAERAWLAEGGNVLLAKPANPAGSIDVAACEQLNATPGVAGAFAARLTGETLEPVPGSRTTLAAVSPGAFQFFGIAPPAEPSVLAGPTTLDLLGLTPGSWVRAGSGVAQVHRAETGRLPPELIGAWLAPDLVGGEGELCLVAAEPGQLAGLAPLVEARLGTATRPAAVTELTPAPRDFAAEYRTLPLAWAWAAAALAVGVAWALLAWQRRTRMAIYATFGADLRARLLMQAAEWGTLSLPGAAWGWGIAAAWSVALGVPPAALGHVAAQVAATWCAATLLVIVVGLLPVGSLLDALKER